MRDFSCLVRKHDRHHLELKTNLPIPEKGKGKYDLSFYFFSPAQLHVDRETVGIDKVLASFQTYTRLSSPVLPLTGLIDPKNTLSPLYRINHLLDEFNRGIPLDGDALIYELQTLVNAFRSEFKGFIDLLEQLVLDEHQKISMYRTRIRSTVSDAQKVLAATRELFPLLVNPSIPEKIRIALQWADESMSLIIERNTVRLHSLCADDEKLSETFDEITAFVERENIHRQQQQYTSAHNSMDEHLEETIAYRASILKKWAQSAMYMKRIVSRVPRQVNHILAGMAAALAMAFAVTATIYAEAVYVKNSMPWALILIISYVFKDRIKEILREVFGRLLPRLLADRILKLYDPATGKIAAKAEVIINFGIDRDQSEEIRKARNIEKNPFSAVLPPQNVLHYNRFVTLKSRVLRENHTRLESLTEITRVRIDDWLKEMDDPEEIQYKIVDGKRVRVSGNRVYHIHLIAALREKRKRAEPRIFHYCLVMNRSGILRIETR
jgi:hypothetical protein